MSGNRDGKLYGFQVKGKTVHTYIHAIIIIRADGKGETLEVKATDIGDAYNQVKVLLREGDYVVKVVQKR